jgi:hypothetical protein
MIKNTGSVSVFEISLTAIMKKHILKYIAFLLLATAFSGSRLQAQSNQEYSATGHVIAEVITSFSAVETSQMNFGRFSPGPYGGKIILTPQGNVSLLGSVAKGSGIHNAASFYVSGEGNSTFSISLPKEPAVLTNTANARTMVVSNFVSVPSPGPGAGTLQEGFQTVYVGATLDVGTINDNPVGVYTGTYTITFDFN